MSKRSRDEGPSSSSNVLQSAAKRRHEEQEVGTAVSWGINCFGQVGVGVGIEERKKPALVAGELAGKKVVSIRAGGMHTVAVTDDGTVYTWGCNDEKALGRKTNEDSETQEEKEFLPGKAEGLEGVHVVDVCAGDSHTVALSKDGRVFACGCFRDPQGGLGFSPDVFQQEKFVCIFDPAEIAKPSSKRGKAAALDPAVQISSGTDHLVVLTAAGKVYSMGSADQGQLGRVPQRFSARDSARDTSRRPAVRKSKGEGEGDGDGEGKKKTPRSTLERFLTLHLVESKKMGPVRSVECGSWSTLAITRDNKVFAWGLNNCAQLGTVEQFSADESNNCFYEPHAAKLWDSLDIVSFAMGQHHTLAVSSQGVLYGVGRADCGRLGMGANVPNAINTPTKIDFFNDKKVIRAGCGSTCSYAVTSDHAGYAWGFGENNQLGTGNEDDEVLPVLISGKQLENKEVLQVSGGGQHSVMIMREKA